MNKAYYSSFINNFINEDSKAIFGKISSQYDLNKLNQKKDSGKDWVLTYKYEGKDTIAVSDGVVK